MSAALPDEDSCQALLDALDELVATLGRERFVTAPLIEETREWFPEPFTPDEPGVTVMALRLLRYAGLETVDGQPLGVEVRAGYGVTAAVGPDGAHSHAGASAWFTGIDHGVARFGVDLNLLDDQIGLAGVLAHEVAHVFRRVHGLEVDDHALEEPLTDLTTVYLGFGILTTNGALRYRTQSVDEGGWFGTTWSEQSGGYLNAREMAFCVAAQALARDLPGKELRRIKRQLEPNQAGWFGAAVRALKSHELVDRLGLPPSRRPTPPDKAALLAPIRFSSGAEATSAEHFLPEPVRWTARRSPTPVRAVWRPEMYPAPVWYDGGPIVFRVLEHRGDQGTLLGAAGGLAVGVGLAALGLAIPAVVVSIFGGAVAGMIRGRAIPAHECSDAQCRALLDAYVLECPRCRAFIAGAIASPRERLDAEDRWRGLD